MFCFFSKTKEEEEEEEEIRNGSAEGKCYTYVRYYVVVDVAAHFQHSKTTRAEQSRAETIETRHDSTAAVAVVVIFCFIGTGRTDGHRSFCLCGEIAVWTRPTGAAAASSEQQPYNNNM